MLARTEAIELPDSLHLLTNWWVIGASVTLYALEFIADKIPAVDLIWNALRTLCWDPGRCVAGIRGDRPAVTVEQVLAATLGGYIALVAHGGKTAVRVAVTPSPEPFSNIVLSAGEDIVAVLISWLAGRHPYWAAAIDRMEEDDRPTVTLLVNWTPGN